MLEVGIAFPEAAWEQLIDRLFSVDVPFRATRTSSAEVGARIPCDRAVLRPNGILWAPDCQYSFRCRQHGVIEMVGHTENERGLLDLFRALCEEKLIFGYACHAEEREHRNRVAKAMRYGLHEAWVGRDHSRYLPGIYWLTVISVETLSKLEVSADTLRNVSKDVSIFAKRNLLVRLYDKASEWEGEAKRIDSWCKEAPGVFSKDVVASALAGASTFADAEEIFATWR
jgi:hypothetical protein